MLMSVRPSPFHICCYISFLAVLAGWVDGFRGTFCIQLFLSVSLACFLMLSASACLLAFVCLLVSACRLSVSVSLVSPIFVCHLPGSRLSHVALCPWHLGSPLPLS